MWFFIIIGFIGGGFCSLFLVAGQQTRCKSTSLQTKSVLWNQVEDPIQQQIDREMHHFCNERYREFDRAAWAMVGRDFTIQMCFGDASGMTQAQKEHLVDEVILNDRRNKSRVGHPLRFGSF